MSNLKKKVRLIKFAQVMLVLALVLTGLLFVKQVVVASVSSVIIGANKNFSGSPKSFLLLGTDNEGGNTDTIILVTINPKNERSNFDIQLTSIPRDTIAKPACSSRYTKINESYPIGLIDGTKKEAAKCMVDTVSELLNVPIDYYLQTNFDGVIAMVDAIGGIEIESDYAFNEQNSKGERAVINIKKGLQTMDGETALGYARQRYVSSDYERGLRQQQVIIAIVKKIISNPTKYAGVVSKVISENFDTNLGLGALSDYASTIAALYNVQVENIASGKPVVLLIKDTPYSTKTNISSVAGGSIGFDTSNVKPVPFLELYPDAPKFEEETMVKPIILTKNSTDMSSKKVEGNKPLVIEIQNIAINSQQAQSPTTWYSWIDNETLYYISNVFRKALGLAEETPSFDYSIIQEFGGPVMDKSGN